MASTRALEKQSGEEETEVSDLEILELEVNEMARKIMEYRSTLPDQLKNRFASLVEAQRPVIKLPASVADPGPSRVIVDKASNSEAERNKETDEKILLLKRKMSSNASAMPIVLKRMNECIARIDKLGSCNFTINPVFKSKCD